jgi:hypothetical protein
MSATRNLVWIASYPKSGNTWVRFMLCNLLFGPQSSAEALNLLAPDIHETGPQALAPHTGLVKTHFLHSAALPLVERTAAAIYVLRQPADVLLSNFHYARRSGANGAETREEFDRYVDRFLENRGDPRWRQFGMGSWDEHVHSWIGIRQPFPVVSIRYEDLTADAPRTCRRLADFLKLVRSDEEIAQAVRNSSFERMRDLEATDIRERRRGIFYKPYLEAALGSGLRFMRSGAVGEGARRLTPEQRARLAGIFEPLSAQLGYQV